MTQANLKLLSEGSVGLEVKAADGEKYSGEFRWTFLWDTLEGLPESITVRTLMLAHAVHECTKAGISFICIDSSVNKEQAQFLRTVHNVTRSQYLLPASFALDFSDYLTGENGAMVGGITSGPRTIMLDYPAAPAEFNRQMLELSGKTENLEVIKRHVKPLVTFEASPDFQQRMRDRDFNGSPIVHAVEPSCWTLADWTYLLHKADDLDNVTLIVNDTAEANLRAVADVSVLQMQEPDLPVPSLLPHTEAVQIEVADLSYFSSTVFAGELLKLIRSEYCLVEVVSASSYLSLSSLLDILAQSGTSLVISDEAELVRYAFVAKQMGIDELDLNWRVPKNPVSLNNHIVLALSERMRDLDLFGTYAGLLWAPDHESVPLRAGPLHSCLVLNLRARSVLSPRTLRRIEEELRIQLQTYQLRILDVEFSSLAAPLQVRTGRYWQRDEEGRQVTSWASYPILFCDPDLGNEWSNVDERSGKLLPAFGLGLFSAIRSLDGKVRTRFLDATSNAMLVCESPLGIPSFGVQMDTVLKITEQSPLPKYGYQVDGHNYSDVRPFIDTRLYLPTLNIPS